MPAGFGDRLAQERREKAARDRRDVLQADVAKAVGTTGATVSRWEAGISMPDDEMMGKVANYFGVSRAWLRYGEEPRTPITSSFRPDDLEEPETRPAARPKRRRA